MIRFLESIEVKIVTGCSISLFGPNEFAGSHFYYYWFCSFQNVKADFCILSFYLAKMLELRRKDVCVCNILHFLKSPMFVKYLKSNSIPNWICRICLESISAWVIWTESKGKQLVTLIITWTGVRKTTAKYYLEHYVKNQKRFFNILFCLNVRGLKKYFLPSELDEGIYYLFCQQWFYNLWNPFLHWFISFLKGIIFYKNIKRIYLG